MIWRIKVQIKKNSTVTQGIITSITETWSISKVVDITNCIHKSLYNLVSVILKLFRRVILNRLSVNEFNFLLLYNNYSQ